MKSLSLGCLLFASLGACAPTILVQQPGPTEAVVIAVEAQPQPLVLLAQPLPQTALPQAPQPVYAQTVGLRSENYPNHFLRHQNFLGELSPIASPLEQLDSTFRMVPGLAGGNTVSFESRNYPGRFLRHQNFRVALHPNDGTPLFLQDASFRMVPGLADPSMTSFQSVNYPDRYIRHRDFHVYLENGNDDLFRHDVTFAVQPR